MGFQINTNARKEEFESIAVRTFDFERILSNNSQNPDETFLKLLILKIVLTNLKKSFWQE